MQLNPTDLPAYVHLIYPDKTDAERQEKLQHIHKGLPQRDWALTRVAKTPDGTLQACLKLSSVGGEQWALTRIYTNPSHPPGPAVIGALLREAIQEATQRGAAMVTSRITRQHLDEPYRQMLKEAGFEQAGGRLEYKLPIEELPTEEGSPLIWKDMNELGLETTAAIFGQAASGASDWDEEEDDPAELIGVYRTEPGLTNDASCFQVGFKDQAPVAFVAAQIEPATGWSRITYMGVVPEARGKGLGKWVHRRGFALMRQQGGTLYHGGTDAKNIPMQRLFENHGCKQVYDMVEWRWRAR